MAISFWNGMSKQQDTSADNLKTLKLLIGDPAKEAQVSYLDIVDILNIAHSSVPSRELYFSPSVGATFYRLSESDRHLNVRSALPPAQGYNRIILPDEGALSSSRLVIISIEHGSPLQIEDKLYGGGTTVFCAYNRDDDGWTVSSTTDRNVIDLLKQIPVLMSANPSRFIVATVEIVDIGSITPAQAGMELMPVAGSGLPPVRVRVTPSDSPNGISFDLVEPLEEYGVNPAGTMEFWVNGDNGNESFGCVLQISSVYAPGTDITRGSLQYTTGNDPLVQNSMLRKTEQQLRELVSRAADVIDDVDTSRLDRTVSSSRVMGIAAVYSYSNDRYRVANATLARDNYGAFAPGQTVTAGGVDLTVPPLTQAFGLKPSPLGHPNYWMGALAYGNGIFISRAMRSGSYYEMFKSTNAGATWTVHTIPAQSSSVNTGYGNGKFVAVFDGTNRDAQWSVDGVTWTLSAPAGTTFPGVFRLLRPAYGHGTWLALSVNGEIVYSETDAVGAWTRSTPNLVIDHPDTSLQRVLALAFGDYEFCMVSGRGKIGMAYMGTTADDWYFRDIDRTFNLADVRWNPYRHRFEIVGWNAERSELTLYYYGDMYWEPEVIYRTQRNWNVVVSLKIACHDVNSVILARGGNVAFVIDNESGAVSEIDLEPERYWVDIAVDEAGNFVGVCGNSGAANPVLRSVSQYFKKGTPLATADGNMEYVENPAGLHSVSGGAYPMLVSIVSTGGVEGDITQQLRNVPYSDPLVRKSFVTQKLDNILGVQLEGVVIAPAKDEAITILDTGVTGLQRFGGQIKLGDVNALYAAGTTIDAENYSIIYVDSEHRLVLRSKCSLARNDSAQGGYKIWVAYEKGG